MRTEIGVSGWSGAAGAREAGLRPREGSAPEAERSSVCARGPPDDRGPGRASLPPLRDGYTEGLFEFGGFERRRLRLEKTVRGAPSPWGVLWEGHGMVRGAGRSGARTRAGGMSAGRAEQTC